MSVYESTSFLVDTALPLYGESQKEQQREEYKNGEKSQTRAKWGEKRIIFEHYAFKHMTPFFTGYHSNLDRYLNTKAALITS